MYRFTPLKEEEPPRWHLRANPGAICSSHILNLCPKRCPGSFFSSSWRSPPEPTPICAPTLRPSPARHRLAMKKATRHWRAAPCLAESRCIPQHHLAERCTARLWHVLDEQVLTTCQRPRRVVTAQDLGTRVSHKHHAAMHEIMSAQYQVAAFVLTRDTATPIEKWQRLNYPPARSRMAVDGRPAPALR